MLRPYRCAAVQRPARRPAAEARFAGHLVSLEEPVDGEWGRPRRPASTGDDEFGDIGDRGDADVRFRVCVSTVVSVASHACAVEACRLWRTTSCTRRVAATPMRQAAIAVTAS
jgi:hypothetical protein